MHAHEYGKRHFKHKTNFNDLVVFSDTLQNSITDTNIPSENLYLEIEKGYRDPNKWYIHFDRTLSGEYGDFYLEDHPNPTGETRDFQYEVTEETSAIISEYLQDFQLGQVPYYTINERQYIKLNEGLDLEEIVLSAKVDSIKTPVISVEYDAFVTLFVSEDGAQLEHAYQNITKVNDHEVVIFIEKSTGSNIFGTVFRVHKGANVKTLLETNRIRVAQVARAYGVDVESHTLTEMIQEELQNQDSWFYIHVIKYGIQESGRLLRWGADEALTPFSDTLKDISKSIDGWKLKEDRWRAKENDEYDPLLPGYEALTSFSAEAFANKLTEIYFTPHRAQIEKAANAIGKNPWLKMLVKFEPDKVTEFLDGVPQVIQSFLETIQTTAKHTFQFVNGLLVGLINSLIDVLKSIFDILAIAFDILNALIQSSKFYEYPQSYLSLFAETVENMLDAAWNSLTLENLKEFAITLIHIPVKSIQAIGILINNPPTEEDIPSGAIGYYLGYSIGFVVSEVATFFATGGVGTIGKALKATLQSYKSLAKGFAKQARKVVTFSLETLVTLIKKLVEFSKNIPKYLQEFRQLIDEFVESLRVTLNFLSKEAQAIVERLKLDIRKTDTGGVLGVNPIVKNLSDDLHGVFHKGKKVFEGTKKEINEFLEDLAKKSDEEAGKYLDELAESKKIRKHLIDKVPGIKDFSKWFRDLTITEFEIVWSNLALQKKIKTRLRHPGGLHEWLMVSRANIFKKWGKSADDIWNLRTKISEVIFKNPPGIHGGKGSTKAHNEILNLIDNSTNYDEFVKKLIIWADNRLEGGSQKLPKDFFN